VNPRLRCFLLGGLRVRGPDRSLELPGGKPRRLLAYLLLSPEAAHPRERLAGLLWPEAPPDRAGRYLSNALYRLRKTLGVVFKTDDDSLTLSAGPEAWVDAWEFERLARSADPAHWEQALALYAGDLLPEVYDDWVLLPRLALREHYLRLLQQLGERAEAGRDWIRAADHYRRLAAADPLREAAHRGLMRALAALGRGPAALEAYAGLTELLARELGASPAAETLTLAEQVQSELELARAQGLQRSRPPFVGRRIERAMALEAVEAASAGHGQLLALEGEAGIGKSRLLAEVAAGAAWRGVAVAAGRATEYPAASPLAPLAELLASALAGPRAAQVETLQPAEMLAALAPVYDRWRARAELAELPPLQARQRFHQALGAVLHALARITPQVLMLDDLHWGAPTLWDALDALVPALASHRLVVVIAYRRPEIEQNLGWAMLQRWERQAWLKVLRLPPLDQQAIAQLLPPAAAGRAAEVLALSGGNPFFVAEVLAQLSAGGQPRRASILARAAGLPPAARAALDAAAVSGLSVPYPVWARMVALPPLKLAQAADQLAARGLLQPTGAGYDFAHDLIREAVYQALPAARRRRLHRAAARGLAACDPDNQRARAFHLDQAGARRDAAAAYQLAGLADQARFAFAEARAAFERALELLPAAAQRERVETLLALAQACGVLGERPRQQAAIEAALRDAHRLADGPLLIRALLQAGRFAAQTSQLRQAADRYGEALDLARRTGDSLQEMESTFSLGDLAARQGHHREAQARFQQVLAQARGLGDQGRAARALRGLGMVARRSGQAAEAVTWFEQALAVQQAIGDRIGESITRVNLLSSFYDLSAWDRLIALADETLALCEALGRRESLVLVRHLQGLALCALGDVRAARGRLADALAMYAALGDQVAAGLTRNALGLAAEAEGDLAGAQREYESALASAEAAGATTEAAYARHDLGALLFQLGQPAAAVPLLEAARAKWRELGNELLRLKSEAILGLAWLESGHRTGAQTLAQEHWAAFRRGGLTGEQPQAWLWALSRLLSALDQPERAAAVLRGAYAELGRQGQAIASAQLRRQFFMAVPLNRAILEAHARLTGAQPRISVQLVRQTAPLGRPLDEADYIPIEWTVAAPDDDFVTRPDERRRHILQRLLAEAQAQGAAPTDDDLARALGVSRRTIERDMAALQAAGHSLPTRRRR